MTPIYPRVGPKPRAQRGVPTMLRLPATINMLDMLEAYGLYDRLRWTDESYNPYITRADAERILAVVPRAGRTGMALRRRCRELLRRWDRA